jgi:hypothetical protein
VQLVFSAARPQAIRHGSRPVPPLTVATSAAAPLQEQPLLAIEEVSTPRHGGITREAGGTQAQEGRLPLPASPHGRHLQARGPSSHVRCRAPAKWTKPNIPSYAQVRDLDLDRVPNANNTARGAPASRCLARRWSPPTHLPWSPGRSRQPRLARAVCAVPAAHAAQGQHALVQAAAMSSSRVPGCSEGVGSVLCLLVRGPSTGSQQAPEGPQGAPTSSRCGICIQPPVRHRQPPVRRRQPPVRRRQPPVRHRQSPVRRRQPRPRRTRAPVRHAQPPKLPAPCRSEACSSSATTGCCLQLPPPQLPPPQLQPEGVAESMPARRALPIGRPSRPLAQLPHLGVGMLMPMKGEQPFAAALECAAPGVGVVRKHGPLPVLCGCIDAGVSLERRHGKKDARLFTGGVQAPWEGERESRGGARSCAMSRGAPLATPRQGSGGDNGA